MQPGQGGYWQSFVIAGTLLLAILSVPARAAPPDMAGLDELAWLADDIVEGHLVKGEQIEVTAVHAGTLKAGQMISVTNLKIYGKGWYPPPRDQIEPADQLLLFAVHGASGLRDAHTIIPAGLHLIVRGRVAAFVVTFDHYSIGSAQQAVPVGDYRKAVNQSVARVRDWRKQFAAPVVREDAVWLMNIVRRERPAVWTKPAANSLAAATVARFLQLNSPALLDQTIDFEPGMFDLLQPGFANADGREYLLSTLADPTILEERRDWLMRMWAAVGQDIETFPTHATATMPADASAVSLRVGNVTRIARAAATEGMPAQTVEKLLNSVLSAVVLMTNRTPPIREDLARTADLLREIYSRPNTNNSTRFLIEYIMHAIDVEAYESLKPKGGPILVSPVPDILIRFSPPAAAYMLTPVRPLAFTSGELVFWRDGSAVQVMPLSTALYGRLVKWAELAESRNLKWGTLEFDEPLPSNLPPGEYRAFIRLKNGDQIVSEWPTEQIPVSPPAAAPAPAGPPQHTPTRILPEGWEDTLQHWAVPAFAGALLLLLIRHIVKSRRRVRHFKAIKCLSCGYDLRATTDRCAECGAAPPADLRIRVLRRRLCYGCSAMLGLLVIAMLAFWVRSYWASDCVLNTTGNDSQAIYSANGRLIVQHPCIGSALGWSYERDDPADMARTPADAGGRADWNILGAQRAAGVGITVIPLWQFAAVAALLSYGFWRLSRAIRSSIGRQKSAPVGSSQT